MWSPEESFEVEAVVLPKITCDLPVSPVSLDRRWDYIRIYTWPTQTLRRLARELNMEVIVSCVLPGQPWALTPFCPITDVQYETPSGRQRASSQQVQDPNRVKVYLYHNDCRNHYDRIVPSL